MKNSIVGKGIVEMGKINKGLGEAKDKSDFMWHIIKVELVKQPVANLVDLRKLINKIIKDKLKGV